MRVKSQTEGERRNNGLLTIIIILYFLHVYSVDTVKTRVQGQPHHRPLKYHNMIQAYRLIWKEEGVARGLYAGITPAMLGSSKF